MVPGKKLKNKDYIPITKITEDIIDNEFESALGPNSVMHLNQIDTPGYGKSTDLESWQDIILNNIKSRVSF